jgi:hypothetical protein
MLGGGTAFADDGAEPKLIAPSAKAAPEVLSHEGTFGLSARIALGLRAIATYDEANYCGSSDSSVTTGNAPVCVSRAPFSLDFELAYGLAKKADVLLELRLGIEQDFGSTAAQNNGPHAVFVSPGVRFWFNEANASSLFATAQAVFDFTGYQDAAGKGRGADLGVRNLNGYWLDLTKSYGVYAFAGETATFARWIRLELEAGIGFQGRYP